MKTRILSLLAIMLAGVLILPGCNKTGNNPEEEQELGMANPASVYCEENGGVLKLEEGVGLCMFEDGSYCEEWSYQRGECQPGEIFYNTISEDVIPEPTVAASELYSEEDVLSAQAAIMNVIDNEWEVKVERIELAYAGDDVATSNLEYCQSLNPEVTECAVFTSSFYIPEQDVEMAGAFEPNTTLTDYEWYLGRTAGGEWNVLTSGY